MMTSPTAGADSTTEETTSPSTSIPPELANFVATITRRVEALERFQRSITPTEADDKRSPKAAKRNVDSIDEESLKLERALLDLTKQITLLSELGDDKAEERDNTLKNILENILPQATETSKAIREAARKLKQNKRKVGEVPDAAQGANRKLARLVVNRGHRTSGDDNVGNDALQLKENELKIDKVSNAGQEASINNNDTEHVRKNDRCITKPKAELSRSPATLHDLWQEYVFGLDGNKAAKDFTFQERGAVKQLYCKRNFFWSRVIRMMEVDPNLSADEAIDNLYSTYGRKKKVGELLGIFRREKAETIKAMKASGTNITARDLYHGGELSVDTILERMKKTATPGLRIVRDDNGGEKPAQLSNHPGTLYDLWVEWEFGIGGNKAAKDFSPSERGEKNNKDKFYMRKFFWNRVSEMVKSGKTAKVACDEIYHAYGENKCVSAILKHLQRDHRKGESPE